MAQLPQQPPRGKPFLGICFVKCQTYGRFYRNKDQTAYEGRCPKCGRYYKIRIGQEGTSTRFFRANCS